MLSTLDENLSKTIDKEIILLIENNFEIDIHQFSEIEKSIEAIEKSIVELEQQLSLPEIYSQPTKTKELQQRHSDEKNTLESLYAQWEEFSKEH